MLQRSIIEIMAHKSFHFLLCFENLLIKIGNSANVNVKYDPHKHLIVQPRKSSTLKCEINKKGVCLYAELVLHLILFITT